MPRRRMRFLGILSVLGACLLGACASPVSVPTVSPISAPPSPVAVTAVTPTPASGGWTQSLDFTGDFAGHMALIAPPGPNQTSECTGKDSRSVGVWSSTIFGQVGPDVFAVIVLLNSGYRGPGAYDQSKTLIQVASLDRSRVWSNMTGDQVTFNVASDEESGTIDATLTNLTTGKSKLKVTGHWSCKT